MMDNKFWNLMDFMRGSINPYSAKKYILGLLTYKKLSEAFYEAVKQVLPSNVLYEQAWSNEVEYQQFIFPVCQELGYEIEPQFLFSVFEQQVNKGDILFDVITVAKALNALENSAIKYNSHLAFSHLFDGIDLMSNELGRTHESRNRLVAKIIEVLSQQKMTAQLFEEVLATYALNMGKKGSISYSPKGLSELVVKIAINDKDYVPSIYDAACGSGSLLLTALNHAKVGEIFGQEIHNETYNLSRMNMLVHGVNYEKFDIQLGDTLLEPKHEGNFNTIVSIPPFSTKWEPEYIAESDPRFSIYGRLAPKSKADFAFIQHMLYHLETDGTMAVIMPLGVLFRGAAEGDIRRYIIEKLNYLDAVISLPPNLLYSTSIPVCLLVFKKKRQHANKVLFIDASNEFVKDRRQNILSEEHIDKVLKAYSDYENIANYSRAVSIEEIQQNDFNLNTARYIEVYEETTLDVQNVEKRLAEVNSMISDIDMKLESLTEQLNKY